jgi:hypothetical protein
MVARPPDVRDILRRLVTAPEPRESDDRNEEWALQGWVG